MRPNEEQLYDNDLTESDYSPSKMNYLWAFAMVLFFTIGLFVLHTYKTPSKDLSTYYFKDLPIEERQRNSCYDWSKTRVVSIAFLPGSSEMITLRAANGEILFLTYIEQGIEQEIALALPLELDFIYVENRDGVEEIALSSNGREEVALSF